MPGFAVQVGATVLCSHAGQAQPVAPDARVRLSGQPAVTQTSPWSVAACSLTGTTTPPCVTAQFVSAALRVRAGGAPLVLTDSQAVCTPTGTPLQIVMTQVRVQGT